MLIRRQDRFNVEGNNRIPWLGISLSLHQRSVVHEPWVGRRFEPKQSDHEKIAWLGINDVQQSGEVLDSGLKFGKGSSLGNPEGWWMIFPEKIAYSSALPLGSNPELKAKWPSLSRCTSAETVGGA
jgi:hypothetical protein